MLDDEEWLVYYSSVLDRCVAMRTDKFGKWRETATVGERKKFPVLAQGLTAEVAVAMANMAKEDADADA